MSLSLAKHRVFGVAAVGLAITITLSVVPPAGATTARSTTGLFGASDPTFDGVYRQSMAIIALKVANAPVPTSAAAWLVDQQCSSGSFQSYRADTSVPCAAPDPAAFSGPDSNSTALAAMALHALGRTAQASKAGTALLRTQNSDGGWGYTLGGASDVNSSGLALAAIKGVVASKETRAGVNRATGYLKGVQVACTAPVESRFGLPYQPGQPVNALASGQGLIGIAGTLPAAPSRAESVRTAGCRSTIEQQVASFLDQLVRSTQGAVPDAFGSGKTDWNATATAIIGLAAAGGAKPAVAVGLKALGANTAAYTGTGASASPAALGTLIQAAVAGGESPRRFGTGRANLVGTLLATLQK